VETEKRKNNMGIIYFPVDNQEYINLVCKIDIAKDDLIKSRNSLSSAFNSIRLIESNLQQLNETVKVLQSSIKIIRLSEYKKVLSMIIREQHDLLLHKKSVVFYEKQINAIELDLQKMQNTLPTLKSKVLEFKRG
jgi:hypothetical protein